MELSVLVWVEASVCTRLWWPPSLWKEDFPASLIPLDEATSLRSRVTLQAVVLGWQDGARSGQDLPTHTRLLLHHLCSLPFPGQNKREDEAFTSFFCWGFKLSVALWAWAEQK